MLLLLRELALFDEFPPAPPDDAFIAVEIGADPLFSLPYKTMKIHRSNKFKINLIYLL